VSTWVCVKIFPVGASGGARPPTVNLGPPNISETVRDRKFESLDVVESQLDMVKLYLRVQKFFHSGGIQWSQGPIMRIWDPLLSQKLQKLES